MVALAVGYVVLTAGVVAAFTTPTDGVELSIYTATPLAYWVGVTAALVLSVAVSFAGRLGGIERVASLGLGGLAVTTIAGLPLIRGYYFYGAGDSLTHLGWMRMMDAGQLAPTALLYPGIHTVSLFISDVAGLADRRAMMLTVVVYTVVYLLFVPLCVAAISDSQRGLVVGAFAGMLLLPVNNVSTFLMPYPTTQAIFLVPLVLYAAIWYLRSADGGLRSGLFSGMGLLLALVALPVTVVHPQQAVSLAAVFVALAFVQTVARWRWPDGTIAEQASLHGHALLTMGAVVAWSAGHERARVVSQSLIRRIIEGAQVGNEVAQRSGSLSELGSGLFALFLKLFLVGAVFTLLAGLVVVGILIARGRLPTPDRDELVPMLGIGLVPVFGAFAAFYLASLTVQPFRFLGFAFVLITVLGAVALSDVVMQSLDGPARTLRGVVAVAFVVFLALQLVAVHPSPYIFKSSGEVTKQSVDGYETAFEYRDPDIAFTGIRSGPNRYVDAAFGPYDEQSIRFPGKTTSVPPPAFREQGVAAHHTDARYLAVTEETYQREVGLYRGLRYGETGFERLQANPEVNRISSSSEFALYHVIDT